MSDPIIWRDDALHLLDQRKLPRSLEYVCCRDAEGVASAIRAMVVRGAPAIGIAAAYGVALAARERLAVGGGGVRALLEDIALLEASRPTAVNLMWALARMRELAMLAEGGLELRLLEAARQIHEDDLAANRRMGDYGAALMADGTGVLTHCNAGALATAGYGTALGVVRSASAMGKLGAVYATETRPWLQGARLTAWELLQDGIAVTLIADSAAAHLMKLGRVQWLVTGADRIAANGDAANKIGTYGLATLARAHGVRVMIAAPLSTIDLRTASGDQIPIEQRAAEELTSIAGQSIAAPGVAVYNPVFDVTPAALIDALVTEKGVVEKPDRKALAALFSA